jgi:hypothetical protein
MRLHRRSSLGAPVRASYVTSHATCKVANQSAVTGASHIRSLHSNLPA